MSFPGVRISFRTWQEAVRALSEAVNRILNGKLNATIEVTLDAGETSTTVSNPRLTATSFIGFCPLTATAATTIMGGGLYVSSQDTGELILAHLDEASTDRTFRLLIIG